MYYFLSLGCNIEPAHSAATMLKELGEIFTCFGLYPFCYTKPEAIESEDDFANALVVLKTALAQAALKAKLVDIETRMGRDRRDPQRKLKSRAADIDIIGCSKELEFSCFQQAKESYVQCCYQLRGPFVDLKPWGLAAHQRPASIHFDAATGNIAVCEDELQRFINWPEATFASN